MAPFTSIGQAAANALYAWLKTALAADIQILPRWPVNSVQVLNRTISVIKVGRRRRLPVVMDSTPFSRTNLSPVQARIAYPIGAYEQPLQIDIWCSTDPDREDLIDQLDDALNAGMDRTIGNVVPGITDDPARDGIVVALQEENGFVGFLDCWFDEPDIGDDPDSIARGEFRATYAGKAYGGFARIKDVPRMVNVTAKVQTSDSTGAQSQPYDTTTVTTGATPGTFKITHGTSTS